MNYFFIYLLLISLITFIIFGIDKYKAKNNKYRISEKTLLFWTLIGGFFGGVLAMVFWRHKTIKSSFQIKFWVIVFVWLALVIAGLYYI